MRELVNVNCNEQNDDHLDRPVEIYGAE
jgi:hypothetical protein